MFGLLKKQNSYEQDAHAVYERMMKQVSEPHFYENLSVPDSFDGRFDMLIVHAFMLIEVLREKDEQLAGPFNQFLFDEIFRHMKITLREIGVGDVGIPKHMQKMMKAFNGRMHSYAEALNAGDLETVLRRNLYGTVDVSESDVKSFANYMYANIERLRGFDFGAIIGLDVLFE